MRLPVRVCGRTDPALVVCAKRQAYIAKTILASTQSCIVAVLIFLDSPVSNN